jgi:hypothetical protein
MIELKESFPYKMKRSTTYVFPSLVLNNVEKLAGIVQREWGGGEGDVGYL